MCYMCSEGEDKLGDDITGNHIINMIFRKKHGYISSTLFMCTGGYFIDKNRRRKLQEKLYLFKEGLL